MDLKLGIRGKLAGTLMIAGLLPLAVALAAGVYAIQQARTRFVGQSFRATAREHAGHLSTLLSAQIDFYRVINHLPGTARFLREAGNRPFSMDEAARLDAAWADLKPDDPALSAVLNNELAQRWQRVRREQPRTAEALITDRHGRLVAAAAKPTDYYQADEAWWQHGWAEGRGRTVVTGPLYDETAIGASGEPGTMVITISMPIYENQPEGPPELLGVAKLALEAEWLVKELRSGLWTWPDPQMVQVWLINSEGRPITGERPGPPMLPEPLLELIWSRPAGYAATDQLDKLDMLGFSRVELEQGQIAGPHAWTVLVLGQRSAALAPTRLAMWLVALTGVAVIVACFAGGWWIARRQLIRPLFALRHGANELEQGHLDFRLKRPGEPGTVFHHDELGELAKDFDHMAGVMERSVHALARANQLRQQFIDLASHELRTPITYILGVTELAQRQSSPEAELLGRIRVRAQRLSRIVENMFKLLKSGIFEPTLAVEDVDVRALAESAAEEVEPFVRARSQALEVTAHPGAGTIRADAQKLRDILNNLLSNAIRFSPDGAKVRLEVRDAGEAVEFAVIDQGMGIDAQDLPHIFEPFYRGQRALARHASGEYEHMTAGIGLGLSVVKRFTELHGGTVAAESNGQGATFRVRLPRRAPAPAEVDGNSAPPGA